MDTLPNELVQQIYSRLSSNDRTKFRSCNKKIASICPEIPSNAFLTSYVPEMLRNEHVCDTLAYDTITLSKLTQFIDKLTQFIDESPQLAKYNNMYLIYNDITKITSIIGPCIKFILYSCSGYNKIIYNWKYCDEFLIATNFPLSNFETIVAKFLCCIFYKS
jgi:hypothetical protein